MTLIGRCPQHSSPLHGLTRMPRQRATKLSSLSLISTLLDIVLRSYHFRLFNTYANTCALNSAYVIILKNILNQSAEDCARRERQFWIGEQLVVELQEVAQENDNSDRGQGETLISQKKEESIVCLPSRCIAGTYSTYYRLLTFKSLLHLCKFFNIYIHCLSLCRQPFHPYAQFLYLVIFLFLYFVIFLFSYLVIFLFSYLIIFLFLYLIISFFPQIILMRKHK